MDVPNGIRNGNAVSRFFMPWSSSRDAPFGGTKPVRIVSLRFALHNRALRMNSKGIMSIPHGSTAWVSTPQLSSSFLNPPGV
jgi:hypothetical protein